MSLDGICNSAVNVTLDSETWPYVFDMAYEHDAQTLHIPVYNSNLAYTDFMYVLDAKSGARISKTPIPPYMSITALDFVDDTTSVLPFGEQLVVTTFGHSVLQS